MKNRRIARKKRKRFVKIGAGLLAVILFLGGEMLLQKKMIDGVTEENRAESAPVQEAAPEPESTTVPETEPEAMREEESREDRPEDEIRQEVSGTDGVLRQMVQKKLAEMTVEEKAAQLFFITPDALTGVSGATAAGETTRNAFNKYPVGGLVFFDQNIKTPVQISEMTQKLTEISLERIGVVPFLGIDEEGGTVLRIADDPAFGETDVGNMSAVGASGDPEKAYDVGRTLGSYLDSYGFNLDFAPVADVLVNPDNAIAKYRSFGSDAELAAEMTARAAEGLLAENVSAVLKHFPGHGATAGDSHKGAAVSERTMEELRAEEFLPFQAGIEAGAEFVMAGHISVPNADPEDVPATLSPYFLTEVLRKELQFDGIIITDAMNMGAITDYYTSGEAAVMAIQAGVDMILMPADFSGAYQAVVDGVNRGIISRERLDESVGRILKVKYMKKGEEHAEQ